LNAVRRMGLLMETYGFPLMRKGAHEWGTRLLRRVHSEIENSNVCRPEHYCVFSIGKIRLQVHKSNSILGLIRCCRDDDAGLGLRHFRLASHRESANLSTIEFPIVLLFTKANDDRFGGSDDMRDADGRPCALDLNCGMGTAIFLFYTASDSAVCHRA